ncbi:unnamed protein product [Orchesella dallaii]|uniref:Arrestin C-terminal-like domain-containing protein n=1 Tax=Orchesella dallaii TaxID=48710 RepID=A0ABP1Q0H8_9HEXA
MLSIISAIRMLENECKKETKPKRILLSIILNSKDNDSDCGETKLEGAVEVESKEDILVHGILLTVHGLVWTDILPIQSKDGQHKYTSNIHVQSSYVFGDRSGTRKLAKGKRILPFTLHLPQHLPSSFDGICGAVKYLITAQTHSNDLQIDELHKTSQPLQIKRCLDLADGMAYGKAIYLPLKMKRPHKSLKTKYVQNLKYVFKIQKTGFALGESIPFVMDVYNPERRQISSITVVLKKKTVYGDRKYHTEVLDELSNISTTEVSSSNATVTWIGSLHVSETAIPTHSILASVLKKKTIFSHQYLLHVKLVPTNGNCIDGDLPIIVGTSKYECRTRRPTEHFSRSFVRSGNSDMITMSGGSQEFGRQGNLPPSYSQTLCQSGRRASLETLPPPYEEAIAMGSLTLEKGS